MKVAFLVSGQLRGYRFAMPTWKPMLEAWHPDLYIGGPEHEDRLMDAGALLATLCCGLRANIQHIPDMDDPPDPSELPLAPKHMAPGQSVELAMRTGKRVYAAHRTLWNGIEGKADYDVVVRIRPDSYFHHYPYPLPHAIACLSDEHRERPTVILPCAFYLNAGGACDRFAIMDAIAADVYFNFAGEMPRIEGANHERRLRKYLEGKGVAIEHQDFRFSQVSADGTHRYIFPHDVIGGLTRAYTLEELACIRGEYV